MDVGLHTTLTDTESILDPEVIAVQDNVNALNAKEFGKVWDLFKVRSKPFETEPYEVLSRNYTAPEILIGTAGSGTDWGSASDTTALPINASYIDRITVGDILLVDSEIVVVKSVDRSGNTIDVYERGAGDTTGATHSTGATAKIIGSAHREGTVDGEALAEQTAVTTNYCQLVEEIIDLSKADTDQARKTGRTEMALKEEAMQRVMRKLARSAIYGTARAATSAIPAMTRGLMSYLNDIAGASKTTVSGAFTETVLKNGLDAVRVLGGSVNAIVMSITNKRIANSFTGADQIQQLRADRMGGVVLDGYIADGFGSIPFVVDLDMPDDKVALINTNYLSKGWKINDQLRFVPETNVNSRERKETLQGKFGLAVEQVGVSHHLLTAIS